MSLPESPDYSSKTLPELDDLSKVMANGIEKLRKEIRRINAARESIRTKLAAEKKFASLSPGEKLAMAQVIAKAGGIPSAEVVNSPR